MRALACSRSRLLLVAPAAADAAQPAPARDGDSLAVGTRPYLPSELRGWRVTQSRRSAGTPSRAPT